MVAPVRNPEPALRVELEGVWRTKLTVIRADLAPLHDVLAVGRVFDDAAGQACRTRIVHLLVCRQVLTAVAVRDEYATVRRNDHVIGLVEMIRAIPGLPGDAEAQKQLARRAELVDLVTFGTLGVPGEVRHPDVALGVRVDAVRRHEDSNPEVGEDLPGVPVELEDGVHRVVIAVDAGPSGRARSAALVPPDMSVRRVDVEASGGAPLSSLGQGRPARNTRRVRVRESLTRDRVNCCSGHRGWWLGLRDAPRENRGTKEHGQQES